MARRAVRRLLDALREAVTGLLRQLLPPVLLSVVLRAALGQNPGAGRMPELLSALCCAAVLAGEFLESRRVAGEWMASMAGATDVLTPVMVSAAALTGSPGAAVMTPMAAECVDLIENALSGPGLSLCAVAAAVAVAGSFSGRFSLDRLFQLVRSAVGWLLGLSMFLFAGLMSARGLAAAGQDTAALRTARMALESVVPVIGGELSDAAGALAASAGAVKNAVGLTGIALILRLCAAPALQLAASMLALRLASAVIEPFGAPAAAGLVGRFGEIAELLLALCAACAVMAALVTGGCALAMGSIFG